MERHKLKCPSHAHAEKIKVCQLIMLNNLFANCTCFHTMELASVLQAQPYVQHDVNAGPAADAAHLCMEKNECPSSGQASNRHAHAVAMGPDKFASLIDTIEQAHSKVSLLLLCSILGRRTGNVMQVPCTCCKC